jgi:hypothetical protein
MGVVGIAALCAAAVAVALAGALLVVVLRHQSRIRQELERSRSEAQLLRARLAELERAREAAERAPRRLAVPAEFLITDAGVEAAPTDEAGPGVPDRVVLSATLGEPLVKAVALAHGVRRALAPESRNRIRFAMRQEVRRSRRQRRREMKEAWRRMRAAERASGDAA